MTATAGADEKNPSHHVTLADATTTIGLMLAKFDGTDNPLAITRSNIPRTSTKISQGEGTYDDYTPPYKPVSGSDTSGGRGANLYEKDKTRYADAGGVWTKEPDQVILSGMDVFSEGDVPRKQVHDWLSVSSTAVRDWAVLYGAQKYLSSYGQVVTTGAYIQIEAVVRIHGSPGSLSAVLYSATAAPGNPNAALKTVTLATTGLPKDIGLHRVFTFSSHQDLNANDWYYVVFIGNDTDSDANHWEVLSDYLGSKSGKKSADGITWSDVVRSPYQRIAEEATDELGFYFEYKHALYYVTADNGKIYRNGWRGAADANGGVGELSLLKDATAPFTADRCIGAIVELIEGPGADEPQNWRDISDNATNSLTVTPDWKVVHTTATSYVVKKTNYWTLVTTLNKPVAEVCVAGEMVFFAHDETQPPTRYIEYNKAGIWTVENVTTSNIPGASRLATIWHPVDGDTLYAAKNNHPIYGPVVYKAMVPPRWGDTYNKTGELVEFGKIWDYLPIDHVTQTPTNNGTTFSVSDTYPANAIEAQVELDTPIDLTANPYIFGLINSSAAKDAGDIKLLLSDKPIGKKYIPSVVMVAGPCVAPNSVFAYNDTGGVGDKFLAMPQAARRMPTTRYQYMTFTISAANDAIFIGCATRFTKITCEFATTNVNNNASAMTVKYFGGSSWVDVPTLADGTASPAGTPFAQDGEITWDKPAQWQQGTLTAEATDLSQSLFWVKIQFASALDSVTVNFEVTFEDVTTWRESYQYTSLNLLKDGEPTTNEFEFKFTTERYLYIGLDDVFSEIIIDLATLNTTVDSTLTAEYFNGYDWVSLTITDGTKPAAKTFAQDGTIAFMIPNDWTKVSVSSEDETYYIRLSVNASLPLLDINEITLRQASYDSISLPALTAGLWTWYALLINIPLGSTDSYCYPDFSKIKYLAWTSTETNFNFTIQNVIYGRYPGVDDENTIRTGAEGGRILRLIPYGEERKNCWVIKEKEFGEIQAENEDLYVPVPLEELGTLRSIANGLGACTNDTYLYFTLDSMRVERYYNRQLEDIGPDADEGIPTERQGTIRQLMSAAGMVYAGMDAGTTGESTILIRSGSGWHEVYRLPYGEPFNSMFLQVIPGPNVSRLWVASGGGDLRWVHVSKATKNPYKDTATGTYVSRFLYTHSGYLITPWISAGFLDISKLMAYLSIYSAGLTATLNTISVDYQLETGTLTGTWTYLERFNTSPWQKLPSTPLGVSGRRMRLRFRLNTETSYNTVMLKAWVLDLLMRFPVKYSYTFQVRVKDYDKDLRGVADNTLKAETVMAQLDTWSTAQTLLTFRNPYSIFDNKTVVIEPAGVRPIMVINQDGIEEHIAEITVLEV